ncbi:unnamed protein product [Malus baccata var. baccata]
MGKFFLYLFVVFYCFTSSDFSSSCFSPFFNGGGIGNYHLVPNLAEPLYNARVNEALLAALQQRNEPRLPEDALLRLRQVTEASVASLEESLQALQCAQEAQQELLAAYNDRERFARALVDELQYAQQGDNPR